MLKKRTFHITLITLLFISLAGCMPALKKALHPPTDKAYLAERINKLYEAEAANDWRTIYKIMSPDVRKSEEITLKNVEEWIERRDFKTISWEILKIKIYEQGDAYYADVPMDVVIENPRGELEKVTDQTDYWIYIDGEWYWGWRGWPYD